MQIRLTTDTDYKKSSTRSASSRKIEGKTEKSPFLQILEEVLPSDDASLKDLNELFSKLPEAEKNLIDTQSEENLNIYKQLIRAIARETLQHNMRVEKHFKKNKSNQTVELSVVKIADERLHQMTLLIRSKNNTAFSILKTMQEIRGLLLDARE